MGRTEGWGKERDRWRRKKDTEFLGMVKNLVGGWNAEDLHREKWPRWKACASTPGILMGSSPDRKDVSKWRGVWG